MNIRFLIPLLATLALPLTALAWDDEPAFEDGVAFEDDDPILTGELKRGGASEDDKKKKKTEEAERALPGLDDEPVEEFDFLDPDADPEPAPLGDFEFDEPIDEFQFEEPVRVPQAAPAAKPVMAGPITLDVAGKEPFADNYALSLVAVDRDAVVVELPVLVARSRVAVTEPFRIVAETWVGQTKVSEVSQLVEPASVAEFGPTFVFLKVLAPVVERQGEVRMVVKRAAADGSGAKELFTRISPYALP